MIDSYSQIKSIGPLGAEALDEAFLFSASLPSRFSLRGLQVFNSNTATDATYVYLDIYNGAYDGGSGSGELIWRFPSSPVFKSSSTVITLNSYIQVDDGLYYEWSAASSAGSYITIFYT